MLLREPLTFFSVVLDDEDKAESDDEEADAVDDLEIAAAADDAESTFTTLRLLLPCDIGVTFFRIFLRLLEVFPILSFLLV